MARRKKKTRRVKAVGQTQTIDGANANWKASIVGGGTRWAAKAPEIQAGLAKAAQSAPKWAQQFCNFATGNPTHPTCLANLTGAQSKFQQKVGAAASQSPTAIAQKGSANWEKGTAAAATQDKYRRGITAKAGSTGYERGR